MKKAPMYSIMVKIAAAVLPSSLLLIKPMTKISNRSYSRMSRFISAVSSAVLFFSILPQAFAQTFTDVTTSNRNGTAIEFLADHNIISGYPDGTFRPEKPVSRVEFLKLALLSSNIELDVNTPSNFKDIDENAWYAPYVRKAKKEGWIQGYGDNSFKPEQSVNKVEGLKMIAAIQGWQVATPDLPPFKDVGLTEWFTPYVAYAKTHNFLEEGGNFYIPSASLSRAKTSETLFRAMVTKATGNQNYSPDLVSKFPDVLPTGTITPPPSTVNFTPVTYQTFPKTYFDNITLGEEFPNTFYVNEYYVFQGKINQGKYDNAFVFLKNDTDEDFENTSDDISNGTFVIPVIFRHPGNYKMGVVPGNIGESKYVQISVLPNLPAPTGSQTSTTPSNLKVQYQNQQTTFSWSNGMDNVSKVTVSQGSTSKSFFNRQNSKKFDVIYYDFQGFKPGNINYKIESAKAAQTRPLTIDSPWVSSTSQTFSATEHTFSEIHDDLITYNALPETKTGPGTISFSGKTSSDIYQEAKVIKPDGKVDTVTLKTGTKTLIINGTPVIPKGGDYSFSYNAQTSGRYIIEINGTDGLATLNTPVYVGNGIPLLPDFFDLENATAPDTVSTGILMNNLLKLINQERTKYGLSTISADASLNKLAQQHADDMAKRNFFGHTNPEGLTPDDRRIAMGITTDVGENLARAPNILYAHNGLMRSAIHRENILDSDWQRVGIGITKIDGDYLLVVEEFSSKPLDAAELTNIKNNLLNQVNQKRLADGNKALSKDTTLESVADNWSLAMAKQKFFEFTAPDGSSLAANVQKAVTNRAVQIYILESNSQSQLLTELMNSTQALTASWKTVGLGLQADNEGTLKLTLLLST